MSVVVNESLEKANSCLPEGWEIEVINCVNGGVKPRYTIHISKGFQKWLVYNNVTALLAIYWLSEVQEQGLNALFLDINPLTKKAEEPNSMFENCGSLLRNVEQDLENQVVVQ